MPENKNKSRKNQRIMLIKLNNKSKQWKILKKWKIL